MSLVVWLPMTKDLRQQGLSDVIVTNNGATFDATNGKLGGCYYFNGTATSYISTDYSTKIGTSDFSISLWVKIPTITSGSYFAICTSKTGAAASVGFGIYWNYSQKKFLWSTADGSGATEIWMANTVDSIVYDKWIHLVMIRNSSDSKIGYFYINGIRYELSSVPVIRNIATDSYIYLGKCSSNNYPVKMYLNDFRIYNHALSPTEVKQISQGLVLHYPLNREGWGQENLLKNSGYFTSTTGWTNNQSVTVSVDNNELKAVMNQTTSTPGVKTTTTIDFSAGTYTLSALIKSEGGNRVDISYPFYLNNGTALYNGVYQKKVQHGDYIYYEATITFSEAKNGTTLYILGSGPNNGETWHIKWVKVERGSIATPWCPNSSDALATTMGLNGTTEYDTSGFCNNGTRTGIFSWTSDTPKYSVSQYFNGSSYILTDSGTFSWFGFDKCTVAVWMKPTTTPSSWAGTFGIAHNNSSSNKSFVIGNYGGKFTVQSANGGWVNIQSSNLPVNEWHHCVATLDGTTIKMYFDGELVNTYTTSWGSTTVASDTRVQVGNDLPGSDEIYQGYYSDARIYATALSAEDVKSLYQNCATIDPDGTIRGQIRS